MSASRTLAQTVQVLAPEVGEALLPAAERHALVEKCRGLPPLVDALLEFDFAEGERVANLQQRVGQGSQEIALLQRDFAETGGSPIAAPVAKLLAQLLAAWQKPNSPLYDTMFEVWLEYDFSIAASTHTPSVLIGLPQSLISPQERWIAMQSALDILLQGQWRAWRETLVRTMVACPPEAFVGHIGVNFVENTNALRLHVKRLRAKTLARYLELARWQGDIAAAVAQAERLYHFADHITLCLEVGTELSPRLAFECILVSPSATEPRWAALLDDLVGLGLCTREKRDGFLGWAGMTTPLLTDHDWPDQLIIESLTRPANHLSVLQRRFGQIKVIYTAGEPLVAKGYLRFMPQWLKL